MSIIGIDLGTSITKIIEYEDGKIKKKMMLEEKDINKVFRNFIEQEEVRLKDIEKIILTGVGASKIQENICNIQTEKVDEFVAIGKGGLLASKKQKAIVVSMGTGTAFVRAENDVFTHLGGTGIGGRNSYKLVQKINICK